MPKPGYQMKSRRSYRSCNANRQDCLGVINGQTSCLAGRWNVMP
jgi:hypothetical protein